MRLLASADLHGNREIYRWLVAVSTELAVDVLVLAGDLLGAPDGFDTIEEAQRADAAEILKILLPIGLPVLYLMGNDDMIELKPSMESIRSIHLCKVELGGLGFVGYRYSPPFMGGVFEKTEECIRDDMASLEPLLDEHTVLVTHSPAYGVLDRGVTGLACGSVAIGELIERRRPIMHIHGHVHEQFGNRGRHFNVAAAGHKRAMVVDTNSMELEVVSGQAIC